MGVDFFNCDECDRSICDAGPYNSCDACGKRYCARPEHGDVRHTINGAVVNRYDFHMTLERDGDVVEVSCVNCRGELPSDENLLGYALTMLGLSRDQLAGRYLIAEREKRTTTSPKTTVVQAEEPS